MIGDGVLVDFIGEVQIFSDALSFARLASEFLVPGQPTSFFPAFPDLILVVLSGCLFFVRYVHVATTAHKPCSAL